MNGIPGTIATIGAALHAQEMAAAWAKAAAELQALAINDCRRERLTPQQIALQLDIEQDIVERTEPIDIDTWYSAGPHDWSTAIRNQVLQGQGLDEFVVTEQRAPKGSTSDRVHEWCFEHPGVDLPVLQELFDEDQRFGHDIAAIVEQRPDLRVTAHGVFPTMLIGDIRDRAGFHSATIWILYEGDWARVHNASYFMDECSRLTSSRWNLIRHRRERGEREKLVRQIQIVRRDDRQLETVSVADAEHPIMVWPGEDAADRYRGGSFPPGWHDWAQAQSRLHSRRR